ncbi:hypothetical protein TRIATDRAFT_91143 [Trichoderma atroviride IMI 206040]|uniref:Uncharacterized protein n=1 Tax=Hypocrea atroviridis (strain ATCC 20476 / IMI 206040) TaxID=452589 RepID=G9NN66_HYPAI|nr:uncharacterized protein TRIATDRAFT_91143 [Trichoderma atroviride IMI 206040]EHK48340.1 hypothetical protein TRIATDRAFT_91143 [Trichoderma atroviride IMI 206040]
MWEKRENGSEDEGLKKNRNFNRAIQVQNNNSDGTLHVPTCMVPKYLVPAWRQGINRRKPTKAEAQASPGHMDNKILVLSGGDTLIQRFAVQVPCILPRAPLPSVAGFSNAGEAREKSSIRKTHALQSV